MFSPACGKVSSSVVGRHGHRHYRARFQIHRVLGLVRQVGASILHLGDAGFRIVRIHPIVIRSLLRSLAIQLG
jgi:hypothetical protein